MKLDHFVVHIDNSDQILDDLKKDVARKGFPFEPAWGKGTKGFKASNLFIGRQYFEIIRILNSDGGGWVKNWVHKYNAGKRGLFCIFLAIDEIQKISEGLSTRGIRIQGPERISFKFCFGLFKKTLPWQLIYLPAIPGTDLELGFIQYDPDTKDSIKQYFAPNSDENGITGIHSATLSLPFTKDARDFLLKVFPAAVSSKAGIKVPLENGVLEFVNGDAATASLYATVTNPELGNRTFSLMNVSVSTTV